MFTALRRFHIGRPPVHLLVFVTLLLAAVSTAIPTAAARVFKSTDAGRTWSRSDRGLPGNSRLNAFGSAGGSLLAGTDSGIFISRDRGKSWQTAGGVAGSSGRVVAFAELGRKAYAGTDRSGILESSDQGVRWSRNESFRPKNVRALLGNHGSLYAGTDADGVFVSKDNGRNWHRLAQGFPRDAQVFALAALKGTVFAGLYRKGLYQWDDAGPRWSKSGPVYPLALATIGESLVAGHNPGGIYTSDDLGANWSKATSNASGSLASPIPDPLAELSTDAPVWELASGKALVFAGAGSGIYYSQDSGRTWTRARQGLPEESPGVAFLLSGDLVLAATPDRITDESDRSNHGMRLK